MDRVGDIDSVETLHAKVAAFAEEREHHAHVRLWYRGHADEEWKLEPGVYRPTFLTEDEAKGTSDEIEKRRLTKERHLTQEFQLEGASLLRADASPPEIYFIQQHYGMPTRLLDWTMSPLTALFLAVSEKKYQSKPGTLFMLDAYRFKEFNGNKGVATRQREALVNALKAIFEWRDDVPFPPEILPLRPHLSDLRIIHQRGAFTFHGNDHPMVTESDNETLRAYRIPGGAVKRRIERELRLLGVNEFSIYGDLPNLATRLRIAHDVR